MSFDSKSVWRPEEMKKRIWVVGKGRSCLDLPKYLKDTDAICSINDGASHIDKRKIQYVFFTDLTSFKYLDPIQSRVERFISPEPLSSHFDQYPKWLRGRWTYYSDRSCCGDRAAIERRILQGGIVHHHSTTAAIHWLSKYSDYDCVAVIGVDGGNEYANGKECLNPTLQYDLDLWRLVTERVVDICSRVYRKQIEFYRDRS